MPRNSRLQTAAQGYIDREQFASIEWLVEAKGQVLTSGKVDPSAGSGIPADALYRIYSMTKPIVSVMALMLSSRIARVRSSSADLATNACATATAPETGSL